ncbi:MAG: alpha/beta fold hydrolase [Paracoccaceae bacterium]|jgi:pimeloyl-ACP methyl ester carboxylesterase
MPDILLVHGSCHGAWAFRDLAPALQDLGYTAFGIDLPGHGNNPRPITDITLDLYADAILDAFEDSAIVLGHSMAGFPISAAAEKAPDRIDRLIYLCAYVPRDGVSLIDMRKEAQRQPILEAVERTADGLGMNILPHRARELFYQDCSDAVVEFAISNLCTQAIKPQATPIQIGENYASVPKSYIRCTNDQTIPPEHQLTMVSDWDQKDVYDIARSHSPFFSDPLGLAALIDHIIKD